MRHLFILGIALFFINLNIQAQITWGAAADVAASSFGNNHPRVVMDASDNPLIIWSSGTNAMFSRWNGIGFTSPIALNSSPIAGASWMGPDIASHGDTVYVVFKESPENSNSSNIYCLTSFNGGQTFSAPVQVDNIGVNLSRFPTITTDDLGNPIVAFMKFNSSFANAEWVVAKSADYGNTFGLEVLASGWSSATSEACDCCPGSVISKNGNLAMMYRDNNSNIRDTWAGISSNNGTSFNGGMNVDQKNWSIMSCPSSGPDGFIIGDTLYSSFMNGSGPTYKIYYNKNSISTLNGSSGIAATGAISGLNEQNYPRISNSNYTAAMVWKQNVSGKNELSLVFTSDIRNGFNSPYTLVANDDVTNADVDLQNGNIIVVWQDFIAGTVKYRMGTYSTTTDIENINNEDKLSIYPNPVKDLLNFKYDKSKTNLISLTDIQGKVIYRFTTQTTSLDISSLNKGVYFVNFNYDNKAIVKKIIKK